MTALPSGTLTFLAVSFVSGGDVAIRPWTELVASNGGVVVGHPARPSVWLAVFARPADAVAVALDTGARLGGRTGGWSVRCGVNTAAAQPEGSSYPDHALAPVLALCDAGQPGDVLLSNTAAELTRDDLPAGSTLVDLGAVRLPGLVRRIRAWRLSHRDLPNVRGPLATLDALLHGVPEPASSFVGRRAAVSEVVDLLASNRLLSLVGLGGVGKTRLAVAAAVEWAASGRVPDGVHFIDLASLDSADMLVPAIAHGLGLSERAEVTVEDAVQNFFVSAEALLVLDNCERMADAVADASAQLIAGAPELRVLVTSRRPLGSAEERSLGVEPLGQADAMVLFRDRAVRAHPSFDASGCESWVAEICRLLDGIPLAIELVAARADVVTPEAIGTQLRKAGLLDFAAPRADVRQRSMRAALEWSFGLLSRLEAVLIGRLAVFEGGFDAQAVDAVCGFPPLDGVDRFTLLTTLIDHSLVRTVEETAGRWRLPEPVRELALERFCEAGEADAVGRRHAAWYRALSDEADQAGTTASEALWLDRLDREHANLLAALHWEGGTPEERSEHAAALGSYWHRRGRWSEGGRELGQCLRWELSPAVRARVAARLGALLLLLGDTQSAEKRLTEVEELGDHVDWRTRCEALSWLAMLHSRMGRDEPARAAGRRAVEVATDAGDDRARGRALNLLAQVEHQAGDIDILRALQLEALAAFRAAGDRYGEAHALHGVGRALLALGDREGASRRIEDAHRLFVELGDPFGRAVTALGLAAVELSSHRARAALTPLSRALDDMADLGDPRGMAHALHDIALAALDLDVAEDAVRLLGAASRLFDNIAMVRNTSEQEHEDQSLERARAVIGAAAVDELWLVGRATPTASAVSLARRVVESCSSETTASPPPTPPPRRLFRVEGEQVRIEFGGTRLFVARSKGTEYLARLLAEPGREFHAIDLAGPSHSHPSEVAGLGPALDAPAKEAYRRRLRELEDELDEASSFNDPERAARVEVEMEALTRELSAAVGLFGRDRKPGTAAERARQSVTKAIKAAVARIDSRSPTVGRHLRTTVRTGTFCAYAPESPEPWEN